ncbi:MAG: hypothetical protein JKX70_05045 [Phycisphaerales bacterium]|nr:hypothetical protein [Phycisphaerales bacterium]
MTNPDHTQTRHSDRPTKITQGLACPTCGCEHLPVLYTRHRLGSVRRVRQCRSCGRRIKTTERAMR